MGGIVGYIGPRSVFPAQNFDHTFPLWLMVAFSILFAAQTSFQDKSRELKNGELENRQLTSGTGNCPP